MSIKFIKLNLRSYKLDDAKWLLSPLSHFVHLMLFKLLWHACSLSQILRFKPCRTWSRSFLFSLQPALFWTLKQVAFATALPELAFPCRIVEGQWFSRTEMHCNVKLLNLIKYSWRKSDHAFSWATSTKLTKATFEGIHWSCTPAARVLPLHEQLHWNSAGNVGARLISLCWLFHCRLLFLIPTGTHLPWKYRARLAPPSSVHLLQPFSCSSISNKMSDEQ